MRYDDIPADTAIQPSSRSRFYSGGDTGVLVIHGFTGTTDEMQYLAERLHGAGFTVSLPRLPGHGTNRGDFLRTGARDWTRRVIDAYLELRCRCREVYVAGLSMGGLLTIVLAARFPVERIALCAPALTASNKLIPFTPLLKFVLPGVPSPYQEKSDDPERRFLAREYWKWHATASIAELHALQRRARRLLPRVAAEVLTFVSHEDDTVPIGVADIIEQRCGSPVKEKVELEHSPHVMVNGEEKERIADEIVRWFSREKTDSRQRAPEHTAPRRRE
jgi:carboxylesterase